MPAEEVERALTQLTNAELMFRRGVPPDAEYTFRHALVQDAAYETLLRNQRQAFHARIASTIGNSVPGNCGNQARVVGATFYPGGTSAAGHRFTGSELALEPPRTPAIHKPPADYPIFAPRAEIVGSLYSPRKRSCIEPVFCCRCRHSRNRSSRYANSGPSFPS